MFWTKDLSYSSNFIIGMFAVTTFDCNLKDYLWILIARCTVVLISGVLTVGPRLKQVAMLHRFRSFAMSSSFQKSLRLPLSIVLSDQWRSQMLLAVLNSDFCSFNNVVLYWICLLSFLMFSLWIAKIGQYVTRFTR